MSADRVTEARGIALSGASGTGKSRAMTQLISRMWKQFADHELSDAAIVSLRVPSPATLKFVGQMVLKATLGRTTGLVHLGFGPLSIARTQSLIA